MNRSFLRRILGFAGLPFLSLAAPFLALPVIARVGGVEGWAAINLGQAIGTYAATFASLGWSLMGPARIARAHESEQPNVYAESLQTRVLAMTVVLPVAAIAAAIVTPTSPPIRGVSALMAAAVSLSALSPAWYAIGVGRPGLIARYDVAPRLAAIVASLIVVWLTGAIVAYPICLVLGSIVGIVAFSRRIGRFGRSTALPWRSIPTLMWRDRGSGATSIIAGVYSTAPITILALVAPVGQLAAFSSADKIYRIGLYAVQVLGNSFQGWVAEPASDDEQSPVSSRMRAALVVHIALGLAGLLLLGLLGPFATELLFGRHVAAGSAICWFYGLAYLCIAVNTTTGKHVLIPRGASRSVFASTVVGAVCGLALMIVLGRSDGGAGVAAGFAASEASVVVAQVIAIVALVRRSARSSGGPAADAPSTL